MRESRPVVYALRLTAGDEKDPPKHRLVGHWQSLDGHLEAMLNDFERWLLSDYTLGSNLRTSLVASSALKRFVAGQIFSSPPFVVGKRVAEAKDVSMEIVGVHGSNTVRRIED